jgi:hypothetical protein
MTVVNSPICIQVASDSRPSLTSDSILGWCAIESAVWLRSWPSERTCSTLGPCRGGPFAPTLSGGGAALLLDWWKGGGLAGRTDDLGVPPFWYGVVEGGAVGCEEEWW